MHLIVPDPQLAHLIGTPHLIVRIWPAAAADVMTLIHLLFISTSLAQALSLKLFVLTPPHVDALPAELAIVLGTVLVSTLALDSDHRYVVHPHSSVAEVTGLQLIDFAVGGTSALQAAG